MASGIDVRQSLAVALEQLSIVQEQVEDLKHALTQAAWSFEFYGYVPKDRIKSAQPPDLQFRKCARCGEVSNG